MKLPEIGTIEAFALVVDINGFTSMVSKTTPSDCIAQFVRDVLSGGIEIIEKEGGSVVSFMGDAFLSVLDNIESTYRASVGIAKCLDRQCEYLSVHQKDYPGDWNYIKGGPSLKIGSEYGWIDISTINSELLGQQRLLIGPAINYACRITAAGKGNRCHVGPQAMKKGMDQWWNDGPFSVKGKKHEGQYEYWSMNLGDIYRKGEDTYWG